MEAIIAFTAIALAILTVELVKGIHHGLRIRRLIKQLRKQGIIQ